MNTLKLSTILGLLVFTDIGRADPLDTWTWRHPFQTANNLWSAAYGNGQFVVIGDYGTIATSADGLNWVQRASGSTNGLRSITESQGRFSPVALNQIKAGSRRRFWNLKNPFHDSFHDLRKNCGQMRANESAPKVENPQQNQSLSV
jgi:hypothetical protein